MTDQLMRTIITELGGTFSVKPVANYCAPNGICYAIRDACVRLDDDGWRQLGRLLSKEQYAKATEMRNMSKEEFTKRTDEYVMDVDRRHKTNIGKWINALAKAPEPIVPNPEYVH